MAASVREECRIQITPKHNSWKTRITPKLASSYHIQISNLQTKHILTLQSYSCVAKHSSTAMVIITLKTILNVMVGYHFFQVIL